MIAEDPEVLQNSHPYTSKLREEIKATLPPNFKIKKVTTEEELDLFRSWPASDGRNSSPLDIHIYKLLDAKGLFVAYSGDKPVATLLVIRYSEKFSFLGAYYTQAEHRGKGYGMALWCYVLDFVGDMPIALTTLEKFRGMYARSGFTVHQKVKHVQAPVSTIQKFPSSLRDGLKLSDAKNISPEKLSEYEAKNYIVGRKPEFFHVLSTDPDCNGVVILDDYTKDIVGIAFIRKGTLAYRVGPLYADEISFVLPLLKELTKSFDESLMIACTIPEINKPGYKLFKTSGFKKYFETINMHNEKIDVSLFVFEHIYSYFSTVVG
jgi:GNAT superfamily N-acetyltransferase